MTSVVPPLMTASVSAYHPSGRNVEILDAATVQTNFNAISSATVMIQDKFTVLDKRMTELESFTHWVARNHPHVIHEYVVSNAAKEKIGVKKI